MIVVDKIVGVKARRISGKVMRQSLKRKLRAFERRYEMPSDQLGNMLRSGKMRETAETIRWLQTFHALQFLGEKTPTNGTRGTTTGRSMLRD